MRIAAFALLLLLMNTAPNAVDGAIVTFTPFLDSDTQANTSATTPYTGQNQTSTPAGIPDNTTTIYSDTFYYTNAGTGIDFNFDVQWSATGGNLNGTATTLGIGSTNNVDGSEVLSVTVSNLQVDLTNYVSGSVGGIATPNLDSATVSFHSLGFADRTSNAADESIIDIVGSSAVTWGTASGGVGDNTFNFGTDGLNADESTVSLNHNSGSTVDTDFSLAFTRFSVVMNLSQSVSAVPEPSGMAILAISMAVILPSRRRRNRSR